MANFIYGKALEAYPFPNVLTDNLKVVLTRGYTPVANTHQYLSDIAAGNRIATTANLGTKTFALGVFKAADATFGVVAAGAACEALVLYQDTGVEGTSALLVYIDTNYTGLPVTPDGAKTINVAWPASGIFSI